ncbi:MAG: tRNA-dihydrouridine synthase A [archaeon ADurb.Bin336]|nr:MAG: tRNA-dihydrouridine synthase A [archaeon ADurb.Bin336]
MSKIGDLKLKGEVFLAPMADYTNIAYRTLAKEYGVALVYTELISAKGLLMKNKRTEKMLQVSEKEKPIFLQLFGSNPLDFANAIKIVEKKYPNNFAGFDLNAGCSVPKAIKGKYGCALMKDALNVGQIISSMKSSTNKPISIKMRLGWSEENFLDVAREAVLSGVDAITLHPRLGVEGYRGKANWGKIKELKKEFKSKVKIIGNGDLSQPRDIVLMKEKTNCDFEMVGRSAIGNAFFFKQANCALSGKKIPLRNFVEQKKEIEKFFELVEEFNLGPNDVRPYCIGFVRGLVGAPSLRNKIGMSKTISEMKKIIQEYFLNYS